LGVNSTWTWEMVMKEAITDPLYKALKTISERKSAFESYVRETKEEEKAEREKSLNKCRKEWNKAMEKIGGGLAYEDGVKSWWSWDRGRKVMSEKCPEVWKGPRNDEERKILFDDFISSLRQKEEVSFVPLAVSSPCKRYIQLTRRPLCRLANENYEARTWTN